LGGSFFAAGAAPAFAGAAVVVAGFGEASPAGAAADGGLGFGAAAPVVSPAVCACGSAPGAGFGGPGFSVSAMDFAS